MAAMAKLESDVKPTTKVLRRIKNMTANHTSPTNWQFMSWLLPLEMLIKNIINMHRLKENTYATSYFTSPWYDKVTSPRINKQANLIRWTEPFHVQKINLHIKRSNNQSVMKIRVLQKKEACFYVWCMTEYDLTGFSKKSKEIIAKIIKY